jgi:hypothetical protein
MRTRSSLIYISDIDMEDMEKNSQRFLGALDGLSKVKSGEKLYIAKENSDETVFYVDQMYFQSIMRWVYGQKRDEIYKELSAIMEDYFKFLNMLENIYKNDKNSTDSKREKLLEIMGKHADFSDLCIQGLKNLTETYVGNEDYKSLYESYKKQL